MLITLGDYYITYIWSLPKKEHSPEILNRVAGSRRHSQLCSEIPEVSRPECINVHEHTEYQH
jgi:hypothetical protein